MASININAFRGWSNNNGGRSFVPGHFLGDLAQEPIQGGHICHFGPAHVKGLEEELAVVFTHARINSPNNLLEDFEVHVLVLDGRENRPDG